MLPLPLSQRSADIPLDSFKRGLLGHETAIHIKTSVAGGWESSVPASPLPVHGAEDALPTHDNVAFLLHVVKYGGHMRLGGYLLFRFFCR